MLYYRVKSVGVQSERGADPTAITLRSGQPKGRGMTPAISIDPTSGRKVFNTRAAISTDKIAGKAEKITELEMDDESGDAVVAKPHLVEQSGGD